MKMDIVAGSGYDEFYTPKYAIEPLLKYIEVNKIIWCPFDTEESNFVKIFRNHGNKVIATHLKTGHNFFSYEPSESYDYIISNPPYSLKNEVFERLFKLNKKFAMLVGLVGLFESKKRFNLFKNNNFEIMYFDKRIAFFKSFSEQKPSANPPFSSVYIGKNIFPNNIIFEYINKNE